MAHPSSAARPKRGGEEFAQTAQGSSKKPRFDQRNPSTLAPDNLDDEDDILAADVIGKSGRQTKRNAVNIDGYESDSDNDNFEARAAERIARSKSAADKTQDEEQDDMFADLQADMRDGDEDEELAREGKKKSKDVRFMDQSMYEGQVLTSKSGGHVSSRLKGIQTESAMRNGQIDFEREAREVSVESSSSSGSDEMRDQLPEEMDDELAAEVGAGGKKKHAPKLDAFNLMEEDEDGKYDETGNYVRKAKDPNAINDNWLDGVSKKDIRRAKEAQEQRLQERRRKTAEDDAVLASDLISDLLLHLEPSETPLEALQRLNKVKPKATKVPKWKQKRQKAKEDADHTSTDVAESAEVDGSEEVRKRTVEAITGAADALYTRGHNDIYEIERESLLRMYKRDTGNDWVAPIAEDAEMDGNQRADMFEYRWSDSRDQGQIHGPYDGSTMQAWNNAGFFSEAVEFRRLGTDAWSRVLDAK